MRIINAVGPTTSSLSPSFSATRVTDLSFFHISPRIRCRAVPVNKRFPWSSTLQEDHHRANHKRTSSYSFNRSFSISPLFAQSHSHSSLSLLFFFFFSSLCLLSSFWSPFYPLSVQHAASWNSRRRSSTCHRITGHSRFRALEPKHARVVRRSRRPECNRESVDRGLPAASSS